MVAFAGAAAGGALPFTFTAASSAVTAGTGRTVSVAHDGIAQAVANPTITGAVTGAAFFPS